MRGFQGFLIPRVEHDGMMQKKLGLHYSSLKPVGKVARLSSWWSLYSHMLCVRLIFLRFRSELGLLFPRSGILPLVSITEVSRLNIKPKDPQEVRLAPLHVLGRGFMASSLFFPYLE